MALKSETPSPPNGVVDIIQNHKSVLEADEDLEDGEIFDDEEDEEAPVPPAAKVEPPAPPKESIATIVAQIQRMEQQKLDSSVAMRRRPPMDRGGRPPRVRSKRIKRPRDDEKPTLPSQPKKRRKSDEEKSSRDQPDEDEETGRDSSPPNSHDRDRDWFYSDEEDEIGGPDNPEGSIGMGGMRRGRGRRDFGRSRRGSRGRGGSRRVSRRENNSLCKFFLQGNCHKGSDCQFSHQIHAKKFEMCKFYMNDCCVKKDKCAYMHEEFPCKFHHLGMKCYAGKRCKFSHFRVSPHIKQLLIKANQGDNDRSFLHHLQTTVNSRSPTPPDYSDYETLNPNSNYVTVTSTRKQGSNRDDITVDDIDLVSDHEMESGAPSSRSHHRHGTHHKSQSGHHNRHSRDQHSDQDHQVVPDRKDHDRHRRDRSQRDHERNADRDHGNDRSHRHSQQRHRGDHRAEHEGNQNQAIYEGSGHVSDEDEGRTPMPSPSQASNDKDTDGDSRDGRSNTPPLPAVQSRRSDRSSRRKRRSRTPSPPSNRSSSQAQRQTHQPSSSEEQPSEAELPLNLPKKQMELYLRIQQQQREAGNIEDEEKRNKEDEFREENWYSSDEESGGGGGTLSSVLNKISTQPKHEHKDQLKMDLPVVNVLPDFDVSAVSKLMSSVRETIEQQKKSSQQPIPVSETGYNDLMIDLNPSDEKRRRDPRLKIDESPPQSSSASYLMKLPPLDMDLRLGSSSGMSSTGAQLTSGDVDLRQLPFKPVPVHQAAREIDASISSNPPVPWILTKIPPHSVADFSYVHPKNPLDPRLKRYVGEGASSRISSQIGNLSNPPQFSNLGNHPSPSQHTQLLSNQLQQPGPTTTRDPRQRALANDPRRMAQTSQPVPGGPMPPQMGMGRPMLGPPGFPNGPPNGPHLGPLFHPHQGPPGPMPPGMYQMPGDSDMRNPNMAPYPGDIDLRFPPAGPPHHHHHYP